MMPGEPMPGTVPAQAVQPMPTPVTVTSTPLPAPGGGQLVALQLQMVTGVTVVFFTADEAKRVAAQLRQTANQAATGLILPTPNGMHP